MNEKEYTMYIFVTEAIKSAPEQKKVLLSDALKYIDKNCPDLKTLRSALVEMSA